MPQRLVLSILDGWCWLADRRLNLFFWAALLFLGGLALYCAPHRIYRWLLDSFLFWDGGWRVFNGQRPYSDFLSALGPIPFQLVAFGMMVSNRSAASIDIGFISAGLVLGIWAWLLCKDRVERPAAVVLALFVALCTFSPHAIGSAPSTLTHASIYNRLGYSLLMLVLFEAIRAPRQPGRWADLAGGISTGAACSLLFFVKPSFFLVAMAVMAGSYIFVDRRGAMRSMGILAGLAAPTLAMLIYLRFNVAGLFQSLATIGAGRVRAQTGDARLDMGLLPLLKHARDKIEYLAGLLLLGLIVSALPRAARMHRYLNDWWPLAAAACICVIESLFLMSNGTQTSVPLAGVFAILLVSEIYTSQRTASRENRQRHSLVCGIGLILGFLLFIPDGLGDLYSLVYVAEQTAIGPKPTAYFEPGNLQSVMTREVPKDWDEPSTDKYINQVNEGMALIRKVSAPSESVFTLDYVNPFSYALARPPAVGGGPYMSGILFNPKRMPSPDWFLGHVDVLMIAKDPPYPERVSNLKDMFGSYIDDQFRVAAESPSWLLYRHKAR